MSTLGQLARYGARNLAGAVLSFAFWLLWLFLAGAAALQIYIAAHHEVPVPDFVLRALESRAEAAGVKVTFGRATFDPTGRVLVTSPQIFLPDFADPVVTARGAYVGLNPWMLMVGRIEAREVRLLDGTLQIPAMLSPSGRAEPIVSDLDALVVPGDKEILLRHVSARLGALQVSVHGSITRGGAGGKSPQDLVNRLRSHLGQFSRDAAAFARRLDDFEEPVLDLRLQSVPGRGAIVTAELVARGVRLTAPVAADIAQLRARTRFALFGDAPAISRLTVSADQLVLRNGIEAHGIAAVLRGRVSPGELRVQPVEITLTAAQLRTPHGTAESVTVMAHPRGADRWQAAANGRVLESTLAVDGEADLAARTATVQFSGAISPTVLDAIGAQTHVNVRKFFTFDALRCDEGQAEFGPGWRFQHLSAQVALRGIVAHGVRMDEGTARLELDPHRLYAPEAYARIGANFARGSYEQDLATHAFRFLLDGQLRPLDISGWFRPWWHNFFRRFEFPAAPPAASVDVQGIWREGRDTSVFVFADAKAPVLFGEQLAHVRTRLFVRPGFYDALEFSAHDAQGGNASGTFTITSDLGEAKIRGVDVEGESTLALPIGAGIARAFGQSILAPFALANAPKVTAHGHFDGPAVGAHRHQTFDLSATSEGAFSYDHLPFDDVAFTLALRDDVLTIDNSAGTFAGGAARLHLKIWGPAEERRMSFEASVKDASLGVGVAEVQRFAAERKGLPPPTPGKFVQEKINVRADIAASAEGVYGNLLSFHGSGRASLRGAQIGEVPLFGPLSELLKFTALRFTTAQSTFKINGPKIEFPDITLRGANSAIDAHGEYALDRRQLDFRAKVFPFQESGNVIKSVVGAVLSPISNVLEVKLTGTFEKPEWAFVIGPTNLLRSLTPETPPEGASATKPAAPAAAQSPEAAARPPTGEPSTPKDELAPRVAPP